MFIRIPAIDNGSIARKISFAGYEISTMDIMNIPILTKARMRLFIIWHN